MATKETCYISLQETRQFLMQENRIIDMTRGLHQCQNFWAYGRYRGIQHILTPRTRGNIFADHWQNYMETEANATFLNHQGQKAVRFNDDSTGIIIRIKHLGKALQSWNLRTKHSDNWNSQQLMPGMPKYARLEYGYRLDPTGMLVADAFVLLKEGKDIVWIWQTWGERADIYPIQGRHPDILDNAPALEEVYSYDNFEALLN